MTKLSHDAQHITKSAGDICVGVTTSSQLVAWLEGHHTLISLGLGVVSLCLACLFYFLNYRLNKRYKEKTFTFLKQQQPDNMLDEHDEHKIKPGLTL